MEKMPLLGAPGYYCALGYWMAAVLFGYENKRKHTAGITVLLQIVFLVCIIIFSVVTDTNLAIYFLPCFAFAILLLFLMLYLTCEMPLNNICYFTIRSFILGEFTSSLEWQLEIYFREKIAPGNTILFSAVFLLAVHSGSVVIVNLFEKRYKESNFRLHIGKKELAHASLIAVSFFLFSNISNIFKNTPFSSSVLSEILLIRTLVTLGGVIMLYAYHMQLQDIKDKLEIQMLRQTMDAQYANYQMSELTGYITEGQIVLDRQLHGQSIYPPISVLPSLSRLMKDGIGEGYTRADHQDVANQLFSCYAKVGDARSLASVIGEDELSPIDKQYLVFGNEFEHEFIGQGMDENRSMEDTLNKAWELLGLLPREELDRVNTKVLDQYYHPTTIDAVAKAKAEADAMNE